MPVGRGAVGIGAGWPCVLLRRAAGRRGWRRKRSGVAAARDRGPRSVAVAPGSSRSVRVAAPGRAGGPSAARAPARPLPAGGAGAGGWKKSRRSGVAAGLRASFAQ